MSELEKYLLEYTDKSSPARAEFYAMQERIEELKRELAEVEHELDETKQACL